ncbi:hybrid sensor histidine kinase/response regulator [Chitinophaga sp. MM2321]|uniref:ATP-binding response regulator n=1 Tax=Chitinophaga sp. MM2321 TaxID=3137178 RepID=UPI0032D59619
MKRFPAWIHSLCHLGVDKVGLDDKSSVIIINTLAIVTGSMVFGIGLIFFFLTMSKLLLAGVLIEGTAFFSLLLLNKQGKNTYATFGMLFIHCFSAIYFGALLGMAISIELVGAFLIAFLVGGSFFIFRRRKMVFISLLITAILIATIEVNNYYRIIEPIPLAHLNLFVFRWFSIGGMLVLILAVMLYYARENEHLFNSLKKADISRKVFLREISHDLRTPMISVHMSALMLKSTLARYVYKYPELAELEQYLNKLIPATVYGTNIINNILDLSKIEAGQPSEIVNTCFHTYTWINEVKRILDPLAEEKGQRILIKFNRAEVPAKITTDKQMLNQVIINLVANAVKYGVADTEIIIKMEGKHDSISISVSNQGPGISKEHQQLIFDPFVSSDNRTQGGNGLGLHIVSQIVRRLKGEIILESEPDRGSTFMVTIPCVTGNDPEICNGVRIMGTDSLKGKKILIIDDEEMMHVAMKMFFKSSQLFKAENGNEGLKEARNIIPDLIILDSQMPEMNGIETLKHIRRDNALQGIPIILASADAFKEAGEEFIAAGADEFIRKPVEFTELRSVLERLV